MEKERHRIEGWVREEHFSIFFLSFFSFFVSRSNTQKKKNF